MCTGTNPSIPVLHSWSGGSMLASQAGDPGSSPRERIFIVYLFVLIAFFIR